MRVYYSELCCLNRPIAEVLNTMTAFDGDCIELMMDGEYWDEFEEKRDEITSLLKSRTISYTIHPAAWDMNLTSENKGIRTVTFSHYKSCIEFASSISAGQVVIHSGFTYPVFNKKLAQTRARESIARLAEIAAPLGVRLAIENVGTKSTSLYSQDEFAESVDGLRDNVGLLLDIGHANLTGFDIPSLLYRIAPRLFGVHIHDNNGKEDQHLPIGEGSIEYAPIIEALKTARKDCHLILEYQFGTDVGKYKRDKEMLLKIFSSL